jgi:hypothetical protein
MENNRQKNRNHWWSQIICVGIMLTGSVAVPIGMVLTPQVAEASVASVNLFENTIVTNNVTSILQQEAITDVNFTLSGKQSVEVKVVNGHRVAVIAIDPGLVGLVEPNGQATIKTNALLQVGDYAVVEQLIQALQDIINYVDNNILSMKLTDLSIINLLSPLLSLLGINVNTQLGKVVSLNKDGLNNLINALKNLGQAEFTTDVTLSSDGKALLVNLDDGLLDVLQDNVEQVRNALVVLDGDLLTTDLGKLVGSGGALSGILNQATSLLNPAVNGLLSGLLQTTAGLVTRLTPVLGSITNLGDNVTNAAVLGDSTIVIPAKVTTPTRKQLLDRGITVPGDTYEAGFEGIITQSNFIDLNLFNKAETNTSITFALDPAGEKVIKLQLPPSLNFGSHPIQTTQDESWMATSDGDQASTLTTASVSYLNTTLEQKSWDLKVKQTTNWSGGQGSLASATLTLYPGTLTSEGFDTNDITYFSNQEQLELTANVEQELLQLKSTDLKGQLDFTIDQFSLYVPKNQVKRVGSVKNAQGKLVGDYQTTLVWTASEEP